jgi:hypothetical protein
MVVMVGGGGDGSVPDQILGKKEFISFFFSVFTDEVLIIVYVTLFLIFLYLSFLSLCVYMSTCSVGIFYTLFFRGVFCQ